jgi:hypothetical protein
VKWIVAVKQTFEEIEGIADQRLADNRKRTDYCRWVTTLSLAPPLRYNITARNVHQLKITIKVSSII